MSRSGYTDDCDDELAFGRWRGAVASSIRGKRGQAFLRDLLAALDAMPEKSLIGDSLVTADGEFCALGVLGAARGLDLSALDPDETDAVAAAFGIAEPLAREIVWNNDEIIDEYEWVDIEVCGPLRHRDRRWVQVPMPTENSTGKRWQHMRNWVAKQIKEADHA